MHIQANSAVGICKVRKVSQQFPFSSAEHLSVCQPAVLGFSLATSVFWFTLTACIIRNSPEKKTVVVGVIDHMFVFS